MWRELSKASRDDLPEDGIVHAKVLVMDTVPIALIWPHGSVGKSASQSSGMRRTASDMVWIE
jgi:hypothetical protein